MDIREYIESGILEAYILGALTPQEQAQVEADIAMYPELKRELDGIEAGMLQFAKTQAKEPPPALQEKIWSSLNKAHANAGSGDSEHTTVHSRTIPLQPEQRKTFDWRIAAALAMLVGSTALNFVLYQQGNEERTERVALSTQVQQLQAEQKELAVVVNDYQKAKTMMADTGMQTIVMHTMLPGHPMAAMLYWSKTHGEAYVAMNALPEPPKGMQYQLWVIQNGKPVSMGTLPNNMANTTAMQKIPMQVTSGEAFAISLEKEGGNPTPTAVYVLGKA